jgi:hypothetical protein
MERLQTDMLNEEECLQYALYNVEVMFLHVDVLPSRMGTHYFGRKNSDRWMNLDYFHVTHCYICTFMHMFIMSKRGCGNCC